MASRKVTRRSLGRSAVVAGAMALVLGAAACGGGDGDGDGAAGTGGGFEFDGPIDVIVPYAAGGSSDQTARLLAAAAPDTCGTNVVVRNQTGSAGAVGMGAVAKAKPDGQTVGVAAIELAMLNHLGVSDLTPDSVATIMQYSYQPVAYAVPADSPLQSLDDVVTAAKGEGVTVASSGTGSIYHIGFAGWAAEAGVSEGMTNVPFDGAATAIQAALGNQTDMVSAGAAELAPFVKDGSLRALAVASDEPAEAFPDVPTLADEGYEWRAGAILGLIAPPETPAEAIEALNECFDEARQSEEFVQYMESQGYTQEYKPAEEFGQFLAEEYDRYGQVIADLGIGSGG